MTPGGTETQSAGATGSANTSRSRFIRMDDTNPVIASLIEGFFFFRLSREGRAAAMHPWEPLRGGHVRVSELMGVEKDSHVYWQFASHRTVSCDYYRRVVHTVTPPPSDTMHAPAYQTYVYHVSHCCRDRSCHRQTPQASQPSRQSQAPHVNVRVNHQPIPSQAHNHHPRGLSVEPIKPGRP